MTRRYKFEELAMETDSRYTVFGGQQVYTIKYKGTVLLQSANQHEIENWLASHALKPTQVVSIPTTMTEAIQRAFSSNRRS